MIVRKRGLTSTGLHVIAMAAMLCDHLWRAVVPGNDWMNCVGRIAFPIFAFLLVEGYLHTHNLKQYVLRMFLWAVISEIPFDLFISGHIVVWSYQNVLWTFLMGLGLVYLNDCSAKTENQMERILIGVSTVILAVIIGSIVCADYGAVGLLTVLLFYFLRGDAWYFRLGQILGMLMLSMLFGSTQQAIRVGTALLVFPRQVFALFSLVPIWLYCGRQGYHQKWFQYACYGFYPAHLLILGLC